MLATALLAIVLAQNPDATKVSALDVLKSAAQATQSSKGFSCKLREEWIDFVGKGNKREDDFYIVFSPPNKVLVRQIRFSVSARRPFEFSAAALPRYALEYISDGKQYYTVDAYGQTYILRPLNAGGFRKEDYGILTDGSLGMFMFPAKSKEFIEYAKQYVLLKPELLEGVPCDRVADMGGETTYWFGHDDHLLRKMESMEKGSLAYVETYTYEADGKDFEPTPFAIKPVKGAKMVSDKKAPKK